MTAICPECDSVLGQVKDSRPTTILNGIDAIRRRRYCPACGHRWTTFELHSAFVYDHRVPVNELTNIASNFRRSADRLTELAARYEGEAAGSEQRRARDGKEITEPGR